MECERREKIRRLPWLTSGGDFGIVGIIEFDGQARKGEGGSETGQSAGLHLKQVGRLPAMFGLLPGSREGHYRESELRYQLIRLGQSADPG